jgi:hypothetical protein
MLQAQHYTCTFAAMRLAVLVQGAMRKICCVCKVLLLLFTDLVILATQCCMLFGCLSPPADLVPGQG